MATSLLLTLDPVAKKLATLFDGDDKQKALNLRVKTLALLALAGTTCAVGAYVGGIFGLSLSTRIALHFATPQAKLAVTAITTIAMTFLGGHACLPLIPPIIKTDKELKEIVIPIEEALARAKKAEEQKRKDYANRGIHTPDQPFSLTRSKYEAFPTETQGAIDTLVQKINTAIKENAKADSSSIETVRTLTLQLTDDEQNALSALHNQKDVYLTVNYNNQIVV